MDVSNNEYGALVDSDGNAYGLNVDGTLHAFSSGAVEPFYPETHIGAGRALVALGYRAIAWTVRQFAPTYANFAVGSQARNVWKVATGGQLLRPGLKPPAYYWNRADGSFNAAAQSLGHSNPVWNARLIPLGPTGMAGAMLDER